MGLFEQWPYVNFHDMNLDWIIKKIKNVETAEANSQASAEASAESAAASQLSADAAQQSAEASQQSAENSAESETNAAQSELSAKNYADHIADPVSGLVTEWLEDNITPTTPAVDASLTVSGAAADAKVTGDKITDLNTGLNLINPYFAFTLGFRLGGAQPRSGGGYDYINNNTRLCVLNWQPSYPFKMKISNGWEVYVYITKNGVNSNTQWYNDEMSFTDTDAAYTFVARNESYTELTDHVLEGNASVIISYPGIDLRAVKSAVIQNTNDIATNTSDIIGVSNILDTFKEKVITGENLFNKALVIDNKFYLASSNYQVPTLSDNNNFFCLLIEVKPETEYTITTYGYSLVEYTASQQRIGVIGEPNGNAGQPFTFTTSENTKYIAINVDKQYASADSYMMVHGDSLPSYYEEYYNDFAYPKARTGKAYHVGTGFTNTQLMPLLKALEGDESEKTIYVHGGTYDIFEELGGTAFAQSITDTDWATWSTFVPKNTHIIGVGNVILNYMPSAGDTTVNASKCISVLNIDQSCSVENLIINVKNARYCIHDETTDSYNETEKHYKNVICNHYANNSGYGMAQAFGGGFNRDSVYVFENCTFTSENGEAFSFHNKQGDATTCNRITLKYCIFVGTVAVRFGNVNSVQMHNLVSILNSYINGALSIAKEFNSDTLVNSFDVTLIGCNAVTVNDVFTNNNIYPVKQYNSIS